LKLYFIVPRLAISGGVKVLAQLAGIFKQAGYEAYLVVLAGVAEKKPWKWDFDFDVVSFIDIEDSEDNKIITSWGNDVCALYPAIKKAKKYQFAQDSCLNAYPNNHIFMPLILNGETTLITLGWHSHCYYLYRFGKDSAVVNNFIDISIFKPDVKEPNTVCMIQHRDYINDSTLEYFERGGFNVLFASGDEKEVAATLAKSEYFVSCNEGVFNGLNKTEGFPLPPAEAMASGCITFAKNTFGVLSYLSDGLNGFIYNNLDELKNIFVNFNPNSSMMKYNAIETFTNVFNAKRTLKEMERALDV
jgi:glycosyltransferase involved in cell wall biosynthesis